MPDLVSLDVADRIATIRLNRPPMNVLDDTVQDQLRAVADDVSLRHDVNAVIIWGGPDVFAAGADVKQMATMTHADMVSRGRDLQDSITAVARIPKPVVAAITGYALGGGCELALAADLRVCAADATLGQPEIQLGLIPGAGGTQRLPRLIGPARAKELIFSGRFVRPDEALRIGLVDRVVPAAEVLAEATRLLAPLTDGPALALRAAKEAIDSGLEVDLGTGLTIERGAFAGLFATQDARAGMDSFVQHGRPGRATFVGR